MQADGGRLRTGERHDVELDAFGLIETVMLNDVEHPAHRAEFQHADLDLGHGCSRCLARDRNERADQESEKT